MENQLQENLSILTQLTDETIEKPIRGDIFIRAFASVVNRTYSNPNVSLEDVAVELGLSKRTVQRKLKIYMEVSFSDYLSEVRFFHAREKLIHGNKITQTAYEVGFSSPAYFSTCFKKRHEQSPKSWQLQNRRCLTSVFKDFSQFIHN